MNKTKQKIEQAGSLNLPKHIPIFSKINNQIGTKTGNVSRQQDQLNLFVQPQEPFLPIMRGKTELKTHKFPEMTPQNLGQSTHNSSLEETPSNTNNNKFLNYGESFSEKNNYSINLKIKPQKKESFNSTFGKSFTLGKGKFGLDQKTRQELINQFKESKAYKNLPKNSPIRVKIFKNQQIVGGNKIIEEQEVIQSDDEGEKFSRSESLMSESLDDRDKKDNILGISYVKKQRKNILEIRSFNGYGSETQEEAIAVFLKRKEKEIKEKQLKKTMTKNKISLIQNHEKKLSKIKEEESFDDIYDSKINFQLDNQFTAGTVLEEQKKTIKDHPVTQNSPLSIQESQKKIAELIKSTENINVKSLLKDQDLTKSIENTNLLSFERRPNIEIEDTSEKISSRPRQNIEDARKIDNLLSHKIKQRNNHVIYSSGKVNSIANQMIIKNRNRFRQSNLIANYQQEQLSYYLTAIEANYNKPKVQTAQVSTYMQNYFKADLFQQ